MTENIRKIGVDVDEVLYPFVDQVSRFHNEIHGTSFNPDDFKSYVFSETWGGNEDDAIKEVHEFFESGKHETASPIEGSNESLRTLAGIYKLVVVSARQRAVEEVTQKWLDKHFAGVFEEIVFCNHFPLDNSESISKAEAVKKLGLDVLIDDSLSHANSIARIGRKAILFGNYPWNQTDCLSMAVTRVQGWSEVMSTLDATNGQR